MDICGCARWARLSGANGPGYRKRKHSVFADEQVSDEVALVKT
jgi:hypothetical protein